MISDKFNGIKTILMEDGGLSLRCEITKSEVCQFIRWPFGLFIHMWKSQGLKIIFAKWALMEKRTGSHYLISNIKYAVI